MKDRRPVTVLHIFDEIQLSGAESTILSAVPVLREKGVDVAVVSTGARVGLGARSFESIHCPVVHVPFGKSLRFLLRIRRLGSAYDVIHVHTERASFWLILALRSVRPVVRSVHSCFEFTGFLRLRRGLQRRLLQRLSRVVLIAVSGDVAENEAVRFGARCLVLRNWVAPEFISPRLTAVSRRGSSRLNIISIGNCGSPKNHESLLRALALWRSNGAVFEYWHVGSETGAVVDERGLAAKLGLMDAVRFVGPTTKVREYLARADLFVMPSVREGLSLAALEALAMGVPAILSDVPGLRELRGLPGICWCAAEPSGILDALREFGTRSREDLMTDARIASQMIAQNHSVEAGVSQLASLYHSLCD